MLFCINSSNYLSKSNTHFADFTVNSLNMADKKTNPFNSDFDVATVHKRHIEAKSAYVPDIDRLVKMVCEKIEKKVAGNIMHGATAFMTELETDSYFVAQEVCTRVEEALSSRGFYHIWVNTAMNSHRTRDILVQFAWTEPVQSPAPGVFIEASARGTHQRVNRLID